MQTVQIRLSNETTLNEQQPRSQGLGSAVVPDSDLGGVSPCFGYPRTQIPSVLGTQNTESVKYHRLGQVKSSIILLKNHLYSYKALSQ